MKPVAVINVVGLSPAFIGENTPFLKTFRERGWLTPLREPFPAVTCTSQASMLTGLSPAGHGIVGNGWYFKDLAEVGFWKQSNHLMQGEKIYDALKQKNPDFTCAKLFWWYNMYSGADFSVTPRPHYPADGRKIFDVYTEPASLHDPMLEALGEFPFFSFWGPAAGLPSSEWIAQCAKWIYSQKHPTLNLVYIPHLDYSLQRVGPNHPSIPNELAHVDHLLADLVGFYEGEGVEVLIVSEYGITEVTHVIHPNRILRQAGMLQIRESVSWEMLDVGASQAFAVSDHQISHIYVNEKEEIARVVSLFENKPGVRRVLTGTAIAEAGLDHERSGDVILMAEPDCWFTYYYWLEDAKAPDFARCVDIHRKPGYDPVELFLDPKQPFLKAKMGLRLLQKKLGFRYYMDVISLDASLVKGSHGTPLDNPDHGPLLMGLRPDLRPEGERPNMSRVREVIEKALRGKNP